NGDGIVRIDGGECGRVLLTSHEIDDLLFDFHSMIGDQHRDRAANRRSGIGIEFHMSPMHSKSSLGHPQRPCKAVETREERCPALLPERSFSQAALLLPSQS